MPDALRPPHLVRLITALAVAVTLCAFVFATATATGEPPDPVATPDPIATPDPVPTPGPEPTPSPSPSPAPDPDPPDGGALAIGLTEPNPNLMWPAEAKALPEPFAAWRDAVGRLYPHFYRLQLDWALLQPDPDGPTEVDRFNGGCMRIVLPCAPWLGLREQLQALAARQKEGGWETVVTISGTPRWAAQAPNGCERPGTLPRSRSPRPDALGAYRRMVLDVLAVARDAGAELRWWNAWNEPNHPYFLSPQRATCDVSAPSEAVGVYTQLHAALGEALAAAPGVQQRILGDLAGTAGPGPNLTAVSEFIADLPQAVVCRTRVWGQHAYLAPRDDAVVARDALAARGCSSPHEIWVTETGARNTAQDPSPLRRCQSLATRLRSWWTDPSIAVAFQYTAREDNQFPYGLITPDLAAAYPVLGLWQAWGARARPAPEDPAPSTQTACSDPPPAP